MLKFFMPKQCVSCSSKGMFLCALCKKFLLKAKNVRLFEVEENNMLNEMSLFSFHTKMSKIKIVVFFDYFERLDVLIRNQDRYRLKDTFEILEQQLDSIFNYQSLKDINFFSEYTTLFIWNTFLYRFMKFLKKRHHINYSYKLFWTKFLKEKKRKRRENIVIVNTCLASSVEKFVLSETFFRLKSYFQDMPSIIFIFMFCKN